MNICPTDYCIYDLAIIIVNGISQLINRYKAIILRLLTTSSDRSLITWKWMMGADIKLIFPKNDELQSFVLSLNLSPISIYAVIIDVSAHSCPFYYKKLNSSIHSVYQ